MLVGSQHRAQQRRRSPRVETGRGLEEGRSRSVSWGCHGVFCGPRDPTAGTAVPRTQSSENEGSGPRRTGKSIYLGNHKKGQRLSCPFWTLLRGLSLLLGFLLGAVGGFNLGAERSQHGLWLLRHAGRWAPSPEYFWKASAVPARRDHLVALQGRLADEVRTLPVVGIGFG